MRPRILLVPALLATLLTGAAGGVFCMFDPIEANRDDALFFRARAFVADDMVSVSDLFHEWHGEFHPKEGDNLAIDDARIDAGISLKKWGYLGYSYRHQSFTRASKDLTLLVWQQLNREGFTVGRQYRLDLAIKGYESDGMVYAKSLTLLHRDGHTLKIGVGVALLHGYNMQEGSLFGTARADTKKEYTFQAVADYRYTENYLYNLDVEDADGNGFTTHFSLEYRYQNAQLRLLVNDLYGRIEWKRLPYSYVELDSANKEYDEEGYIVYKPTVRGVERYENYTQKLYKKVRLEGSCRLGKSTLTAGGDNVRGHWFPYLRASRAVGKELRLGLSYENRFDMVGVDLRYRTFALTLKSDDLRDPAAMSLSLGVDYRF